MATVTIKGDVVDNYTGELYDIFGVDNACPKKVQDALDKCSKDDSLDVQIASNGGDVSSASEIYTMLRNAEQNVVVNIQGMAASAASVIAMAGDTVNISPTAQMMIHKASTSVQGNADDLEKMQQALNSTDDGIAQAYQLKTGMSKSDILQMMSNTTFMSAQDAVDKGFADSIMFAESEEPQMVASINTIPSRDKVKNLLDMIHSKDKKPEKQNETKTNTENKKQSSNDLTQKKVAILLGKEGDLNNEC